MSSGYVYRGTQPLAYKPVRRALPKHYQVDPEQLCIDARDVLKMICALQMRDVLSMRANANRPRTTCPVCRALVAADAPCDVCPILDGRAAA